MPVGPMVFDAVPAPGPGLGRRCALTAVGGFAAALARPTVAQPALPSRINLVVGFAPGGFADGAARLLANALAARLGRIVTVENRSGAGGNLAAAYVAAAAADGSTLLVTTTALALAPALYARPGFSPDALLPVAAPVSLPELLATRPNLPGPLSQYLRWAKAEGEVRLATAGTGTGSHVAAEYLFRHLAGVRVVHVPYRGGAPAVQAAMAGDVDAVCTSFQGAGQVASGTLRGLAVGSAGRNTLLPDVPTFAEEGFPGFEAASWVGLFLPLRAGAALAARLNAEVNAAVAEPALASTLRAIGHDLTIRDPEATRAFVAAEVERWGAMVRTLGTSINE